MSELGTLLKEARVAKDLSLDDLQEMTKIQKRYLIGIEEGNYSLMPGKFYVRAFIKQYAEAVGLDPEQLFEEYKSEIPDTHSEDIPGQLSRVKTKQALGESSSKVLDFLPKLLIIVVIIALFVFVWWYFSKSTGSETENADQNENKQEVTYEESDELGHADNEDDVESGEKQEEQVDNPPVEEKEEPEELEEPETPAQELTVVEANGSRSTYELKNANEFKVKVVSIGETWVNIKNGQGQSIFQGMMKKGGPDESKEVDFSQETEVIITAGRSSETEIYVNDQKLEYTVAPNEEVLQYITIRHVKTNE